MALAGTLEIQMLANIARLQSDMTQAKGAVGSAMKSIESSVAMAKSALGALGIGLGVGYFVSLTKGAIDAADKINDLSQSMGVAVQELGKYKLATEQSGTTLEGMARGVKGLATAFAEHGAELKAAGINATTTDGRMRQIADVFASMPDGIEKTTLAVKLFGKSGMELIPMLNMGSQGLAEAAEKSAKYAAALAILAPQADKFMDTMAELGMASKVAGMSILNDALPAMTRIAAAMALAAHEAGAFKAAFVGLGGAVIEGLGGWGRALHLYWLQLNSYLDSAGAKLLRFLGLSKEAGSLENSASEFAVKAQRLLEANPPEIFNPKKEFATDKWMEPFKKLMAALGLEGKKQSAKAAGMTFDELLAKNQLTIQKRIQEEEEAATAIAKTAAKIEDDARKEQWEKDAEAYTARLDSAAEVETAIGQMALKQINDRTKADIDAAKKAADYRRDQEKEITRGLTDALMRGFDGGKGWARNFWDSMIAMAKTIVLRPIIEGVLSGVVSGAAGAATNSAAGSMLGSAGSSAAGSAVSSGIVGSVGGWFGSAAAGGVPVTSTFGAVASGAGYAGAGSTGMMGTAGSALAAVPVWGWIALAAIAAYAYFESGGGPKNPDLGINTSGIGGPAGTLAVTQNNFGDQGSLTAADIQGINAYLQSLPDALKTAVDGFIVEMAPGDTAQQAWSHLKARIDEAAASLGLAGDALLAVTNPAALAAQKELLFSLMSPAEQLANTTKNLQKTFDDLGIVMPTTREGLAAIVTGLDLTTEGGLKTLGILQQVAPAFLQVADAGNAAADASKAAAEAAQIATDTAQTNLTLQQQVAILSSTATEKQVQRENEMAAAIAGLGKTTNQATLDLIIAKNALEDLGETAATTSAAVAQMGSTWFELTGYVIGGPNDPAVIAAEEARKAAAAAAAKKAQEAANKLKGIADERRGLQDQLDQLTMTDVELLNKQRNALDESNRALWDQVQAAKAQKQAAEDAARAMEQLRGWLDGMKLNDSLSPLTAQQKLIETQSQYVENLMKAQGGDAGAIGNFGQYADAYLAAQKAVTGFGGDYSAIFQAIMAQGEALTGSGTGLDSMPVILHNMAGQQEKSAGELRATVTRLEGTLAKLMEIANQKTDNQTTLLIEAIKSGADKQASATQTAALVNKTD